MEKIKVIIFGIGEISQIAHYYLSADERYEVFSFTMDNEFIKENNFEGLPIIPFHLIEQKFPPDKFKLFIPLGYTEVNKLREKKFIEARDKGYDFISYVHPKANISSNAKIGKNCFIFEDNTIQPYVTIEDNCILWSGNHIGHHSIIRANCFITSHVVVSGGCEIGENTFIGVNATLRNHIKIGKSNIIGASALILNDTEDNKVFMETATEASKVPSNRLRKI
jgi:sugar O-acyltransferase (sialic acid O-acetyltransferase NeuD family)